MVWPHREGIQPHPSAENWNKDLLNTVRLYWLGGGASKITADSDCSHEIKTLASWKESYDKPRQHIKKQRHHFADKGPKVKSMVFLIVIYRNQSWPKKKAEC